MQVVCATLTGVLGRHLRGANGDFAVVYVDEAAQVLLYIVRDDQAGHWVSCSLELPLPFLTSAATFPLRPKEPLPELLSTGSGHGCLL